MPAGPPQSGQPPTCASPGADAATSSGAAAPNGVRQPTYERARLDDTLASCHPLIDAACAWEGSRPSSPQRPDDQHHTRHHEQPRHRHPERARGDSALKVAWEVLATPITYRVVAFLKKKENEDSYDRDTDFTPFSLKT